MVIIHKYLKTSVDLYVFHIVLFQTVFLEDKRLKDTQTKNDTVFPQVNVHIHVEKI